MGMACIFVVAFHVLVTLRYVYWLLCIKKSSDDKNGLTFVPVPRAICFFLFTRGIWIAVYTNVKVRPSTIRMVCLPFASAANRCSLAAVYAR
jgi:hypothetical protein